MNLIKTVSVFIFFTASIVAFGNNDKTYVNQLNERAWKSMSISLDSVLHYCHQTDSISEIINYPDGKGFSKLYSGWVYFYQSNYPIAYQNFTEALAIGNKQSNKKLIGRVTISIGAYYNKLGDLALSMEYYQKALKLLKQTGDQEWENYAYNNIGVNFRNQNKPQKARTYYKKALKLFEIRFDTVGMAFCTGNIAGCFQDENLIDSAILYSKKSLKLSELTHNQVMIGSNLIQLSNYYLQANQLNKSSNYLKQAKIFHANINDIDGLISCSFSQASLYAKRGGIKNAIAELESKEFLIDSLNIVSYRVQLHQQLSDYYTLIQNHKKANFHLKKYIIWNDSLLNSNSQNQINELEVKYQTNEKILEINNLNTENKINQLKIEQGKIEEIRQKNIKNWGFGIGALLVFLLSIITYTIYSKNKQTKKVNQIIRTQKAEVEQKKEIIEEKNNEILDSINLSST